MKNLYEYSDDELLTELSARFTDFIMCARVPVDTAATRAKWRRFWKGDLDACMGMAQGIIQDCVNSQWGIKEEHIKT